MKKFLTAVLILSLALAMAVFSGCSSNGQYLRIHIRANSNSDADQEVKMAVQKVIVHYLSPLLANAEDQEEAKGIVKANTKYLQILADQTLFSQNFDYASQVKITTEHFPTRNYGSLTLEQGSYEAVIINLGSGEGDNWWCVVFPPLCFVGGQPVEEGVKYKWFFEEFFQKMFG